MNADLERLAGSITAGQLLRLFAESGDTLDELVCTVPLTEPQLDMIIAILDASDRPRGADPYTIAFHALYYQSPASRQVAALTAWCDDPGTWELACDKYPGGEAELVTVCDPDIARRYART